MERGGSDAMGREMEWGWRDGERWRGKRGERWRVMEGGEGGRDGEGRGLMKREGRVGTDEGGGKGGD